MSENSTEVKQLLDAQGKAFETFKETVNSDLKKYGDQDSETKSKLAKINDELDKLGKEIDTQAKRIASAASRSAEAVDIAKKRNQLNAEIGAVQLSFQKAAPAAFDDAGYEMYEKGFDTFLRSGRDQMSADQLKTMMVSSDPDGGYTVTPDVSGRVVQKIYDTSPIRQYASVQAISTDSLEGTTDLGEGSAGWVSETGARPATNTPQTGKWKIVVHEMYAMPEATTKLLQDSNVNIAAWLANKTSRKFLRMENAAFVNGDGVGKPRGFLTYPTVVTGDATRAWEVFQHIATGGATLGADPNGAHKLIDVVHSLHSEFLAGSNWAMNRLTLGEIRKLKDTNGNFLWLPSLDAKRPDTLLGYPVADFADMPDIGAGALPVVFGNFAEGYQIVDRLGIRVIRDELTNKPFVRFYTIRRVGGDVINFEALKFLKCA